MRNLFLSMLVLTSFIARAQNTKPFKVNVAAGYAAPADRSNSNAVSKSKAGFVASIEPQYRLIKNLDVGLRVEQAFIQRPEFIDQTIVFQTRTKSILSGVVTANYSCPIGGTLQPYVGAGVGLYHTDPSEQRDTRFSSTVSYPLPATNVIGGLGRVGVKFGRVNLEANYNLVSDTRVINNATKLTLNAKNAYASVKVGFTIGGGSNK